MTRRGRHTVVLHAHFYQPPREEPWLDTLERESGAAPFHDWNERIERECYRAVVAARLPDAQGRIRRIINTLESISFNAGPTLLAWMERAAPDTYARFLQADAHSLARLGHGNALAMPYHHVILPLASRRDKRTEVRWGIADFARRFGRPPEGMWLPETAVDDETLDVVAEAGIGFTILAPSQVTGAPHGGMPGRYTTANGRSIAVAVYDGPISHQVAFGPLIRDGAQWLDAIAGRHSGGPEPVLTTVATDGETYGHHHAFGEMALAAAIAGAPGRGLSFENLASVLARHPATEPISLIEPSSWSCAHGVERWRSDCGCRLDPVRFPSQAWRAPLREALEWLAGELHARFEREGALLLGDPWAARDTLAGAAASPLLLPAARGLLEMERNALRMFTSCGWFFDDLGGIETVQCLRYAVRAIELAGEERTQLLEGLMARLADARSNDPRIGTGGDLLRDRVIPAVPGAVRAAAGHIATQVFPWGVLDQPGGVWDVQADDAGDLRLLDTRIGELHQAGGSVARDPQGRLVISVRLDAEDATYAVTLAALPEAHQAVVRAALISALFPDDLATGLYELGVTPREAVANRLLELLPSDLDLRGLDPALLHGALDLLDLEGAAVPFDVQTRFWHLLSAAAEPLRAALVPFRIRMGFSPDATAGPP